MEQQRGSRPSSLSTTAGLRTVQGRTATAGGLALALRGSAEEKKKDAGNALSRGFGEITPTTRMWLLGCLVMATLTLVGVPEVRNRKGRGGVKALQPLTMNLGSSLE